MTRKQGKASGKRTTQGTSNGTAPYCGRPDFSPADMQAFRKIEAFLLMRAGVFRHCRAGARPRFEPNDRHKRIDFLGHARALIGSADGISASAPDDTLADHLYIAADPFSDLNSNFADFVAEAMGIDEGEVEEQDAASEHEQPQDDIVVETEDDAEVLYSNFRYDSQSTIALPAHSGVAYSLRASRKREKNRHLWEMNL